jgi:hypothetical protein
VGDELAEHFGVGELWPEHVYGGGGLRGPDWTVVEGRHATVFECKTSRLTLDEREAARISDIRARLRKDIVPALQRLPDKIEHLRRRNRGLEQWPEIDEVECVIVTLEPWWPETVTRELIREELRGHPAASLRYHLMWVEQLEQLGSFRARATIFDVLRSRWSVPPTWDTHKHLFEQAKHLGVKLESPRLRRLSRQFFGRLGARLKHCGTTRTGRC